jgi:CRP-like cAMP-binding protein
MKKERHMKKKDDGLVPIVRLNYDTDDLIIKEGNYGVSIYYILSGKVEVYTQTNNSITTLTILEKGEIFGEMAFLYGSKLPRTASVRAIEPTVLEAHHQSRFLEDYKKISPMLKYITDQVLMDLMKLNKKITHIDNKLRKIFAKDPWSASRRYFRKDIDVDCVYKPVHSDDGIAFWGRIVDISKGGLKMYIDKANTKRFSHKKGDVFSIATSISKGRQFVADAKIIGIDEMLNTEKLICRMSFIKISEDSLKKLGFFLMK